MQILKPFFFPKSKKKATGKLIFLNLSVTVNYKNKMPIFFKKKYGLIQFNLIHLNYRFPPFSNSNPFYRNIDNFFDSFYIFLSVLR